MAGRARVRVSRDGGRTYPARGERVLDARLPSEPAAVLLHDAAGGARCLAADFDVSHGGRDQVDADAAGLAELVEACGGRTVADVSPAGGRHVYVFWAAPVPIEALRPLMHALAARFPSLDPTPMLNPTAGCIRPPGARHRTGGLQILTTPLPAAQAAVAAPCGPAVWTRLHEALAPELAALTAPPPAPDTATGRSNVPGRGCAPGLSARVERIARTGVYDAARYATPSEARQAVVTAAAAAAWSLTELAARLEEGTWPGLRGLYERYRVGWRSALARDFRKAQSYLGREKSARRCPTRVTTHSAPPRPDLTESQFSKSAGLGVVEDDVYGFLRTWDTGMRLVERVRYTDRAGLSKRLLWRAVGAMAQRRGTRYLDVGRRSLALACGLDDATVSRLLREIRAEDDPWLVLIEADRGVHGDLYELRVPAGVAEAARWRRWRPGRIEAIHPAFRALGGPAALVYEALTAVPAKRRDLTRAAALSPRTVDEALMTLAAHGLAERVPHEGWRRGPVALDAVASALGVDEQIAELQRRYAVERAAWRVICGATRPLYSRDVIAYAGPGADLAWPADLDDPPDPTGPDEHDYDQDLADLDEHERHRAAIDLLRAELGAAAIADPDDWPDPRYGTFARSAASAIPHTRVRRE